MMHVPLPIDPILPMAVAALRRQPAAVLRAPTGAGKTTRVPPALLDGGVAGQGCILMLEPRRLAARAAARRMADERGTALGGEVGYHVRFERRCGPDTKILVVTPGILLRMLLDDAYLESAGVVIFDEFHERGLESDLALGMARLVQQTVRPELRIVVMSATLAVEAVAAYLGGCPIISSEGRLFPVEIVYEPKPQHLPWPAAAATAAARLFDRTDGDLLVFLPGLGEIRQTARHLETMARERDVAMLPLYGELPLEQQDAALLHGPKRKIVLATNVAETSVTVEGITGVVDTGLARQLVFDPGVGLDRLKLTPVSRASTEQRAGRAGRTQPGMCVRLWSASAQLARPEQTLPEIRRVDLAAAVLQLLCIGERNIERFPWLEAPPAATVEHSRTLLHRLGAIDDRGVTDVGRLLARLPVHPRLGRMLVEGHRHGQAERVALAAALLAERDPFTRGHNQRDVDQRHATRSDVLDRIEVLEEFEHTGRAATALGALNRGTAKFILRARDQLTRSVKQEPINPTQVCEEPAPDAQDVAVLRSLLAAFPERVARRREPGSPRGVMVGGRGVRLASSSGVTQAELFLCIDVDAGATEAVVRLASAIEREWLSQDKLRTSVDIAFDAVAEKVTAWRRVRYEDLVIEETPATLPAREETAPILAAAAAERLERVLPAADSPAGLFLKRIRCLRQWLPELNLPAFDDAQLRELLPWLCHSCRSFADVRNAGWLEALLSKLTHAQLQALNREAPERLQVPSGSRVTVQYEIGRPPVLAVRIQEVFGLGETPRIAAGRVPVLLHLLAPNFRPQQVTDDLASFWANMYPQVRKELRARYPRHAWPDDPLTAMPERRPHRRK